jgi:hypothetical protein
MLLVDAGNNHVNIGNNDNPGGDLNVVGTATGNGVASTHNIVISSANQYGSNANPKNLRFEFIGYRDGVGANGIKARINASETTVDGRATTLTFDVNDTGGLLQQFLSARYSEVVFNNSSNDMDFRVESDSNSNMLFVDAGNNVLGIGTNAPTGFVGIKTTAINVSSGVFDKPHLALQVDADPTNYDGFVGITYATSSTDNFGWSSGAKREDSGVGHYIWQYHANNAVGTERMRITNTGEFVVGKTSNSHSTAGFGVDANTGIGNFVVDGNLTLILNRYTDDGTLVSFRQDHTQEGSISVSGTLVSYNGGHLSRWSQLVDNTRDNTLVKGTVMTNLDQMAEWTTDGVTEDNEQLNCMAVSSVEGDVNVAGVFINWDDDDDIYTNDMNIAMTGDVVIRIAQGTTVARGDLLMSAGDGTAKPQGDDIVRSKTIAKVTSTNVSHTYDDGTYLVPCVLMAC